MASNVLSNMSQQYRRFVGRGGRNDIYIYNISHLTVWKITICGIYCVLKKTVLNTNYCFHLNILCTHSRLKHDTGTYFLNEFWAVHLRHVRRSIINACSRYRVRKKTHTHTHTRTHADTHTHTHYYYDSWLDMIHRVCFSGKKYIISQ